MSTKQTTEGQLEGREAFVTRLIDELRGPSALGVVVMGETGAGKTTVAGEVQSRLAPGEVVLRIRGSAVLTRVPFGALSAYLQGMRPEDMADPASVLRRIVQHLPASVVPLPLILIDDAHDVDDDTVALLVQLIAGGRVRALILACPLPGLPAGFERLVADGLLNAVAMEPLTPSEVEGVCTSVLEGPVVSAVGQITADIIGGNPRFLHTFLRDGVNSGYLRVRNGVWHAAPQSPPVGRRLADLVQAGLASLEPQAKEAMTVLALAGPTAESVVHELIDQAVLEKLLDVSLLRTTSEGLLVLSHPLHVLTLRGAAPTARRVRLQRQILAAMSPPRDDDEVLRYAFLALDAGVPVDDELLLRAATVANRLHDGPLALRALRAIESPRLRGPRLVQMAWAESGNDVGKALELVAEVLAVSTDEEVLCDAIMLALILSAGDGTRGGNVGTELDRWQDLLWRAQTVLQSADRADMSLLTLIRSVVPAPNHRGIAGTEAVRDIAGDERVGGRTRIAACLVLSVGLLQRGRPAEAASLASRAVELSTEDAGTRALRDYAAGLHILALLTAGEGDQARSAFHSFYRRRDYGSILYFAGWLDLIEGMVALRAGRFPEAQSRLLLASEALRAADLLLIRPWVAAMAAYAAVLAGDLEVAAQLASEDALSLGGSRLARLLGDVFRQSVVAALDADTNGSAQLVHLADLADEAGLHVVAAAALDQALVLGDRSVLERLADLTAGFDGEEHRLLHAYARAAADGLTSRPADSAADDAGRRLLEVGKAAGAAGYRPLAARCYEQAREVFEQRQDSAGVRLALKGIAASGVGMEGPVGPHAVLLPAGVRLTPREAAVAKLAAAGLSNREIAERQSVSVRTIEGHLYRIYAKSGITRREDLHHLVNAD